MRKRAIETARMMRQAGWPVSTGELVDFFKALQLVNFRRDDILAAALCTMAKDKQAREYLYSLFLRPTGENKPAGVIPETVDVQALLASPPQLPPEVFADRMQELKDSIRRDLLRGFKAQSGRGGSRGRNAHTGGKKDIIPREPEAGTHHTAKEPVPTNLRLLDLAGANSDQLEEIRNALVSLGKRLAVKRGYRKKPATRGTVDMRRTVRAAVTRDGIPLVLKRERRIPSSPLLVTLCDLSGSVAPYSEFFLKLLTGLHHNFRALRSFAFVDHVAEVTQMIKETRDAWSITARRILREARISRTGFSHYGLVWEHFHQLFSDVLNQRTTLIILGDARNNWQPDGIDHFKALAGLCRRIIWLNPLPREKWSSADCIMEIYAPHCHTARECRNAQQLSGLIREIM